MIDVHSHALPEFLVDALTKAGKSPSLGRYPEWREGQALSTMDRFGIERSILSISAPGIDLGDYAAASALARRYNIFLAELRERTNGRFGGFAALPLSNIECACAEAEYALDALNLEGVGLFGSYGSWFLGDPRLDPLLQVLDGRAAVVFIHPAGHDTSWSLDLPYPVWMFEYPVDTTRAAISLVMSGATKRYPNIRFILAHNGGALPYLMWRLTAAPLIDRRYRHLTREGLRSEFARFYYESAQSPGDEAYSSLLQSIPQDHLLFGSDWPYCREDVLDAMLVSFNGASLLTPDLRRKITVDNAAALLPSRF